MPCLQGIPSEDSTGGSAARGTPPAAPSAAAAGGAPATTARASGGGGAGAFPGMAGAPLFLSSPVFSPLSPCVPATMAQLLPCGFLSSGHEVDADAMAYAGGTPSATTATSTASATATSPPPGPFGGLLSGLSSVFSTASTAANATTGAPAPAPNAVRYFSIAVMCQSESQFTSSALPCSPAQGLPTRSGCRMRQRLHMANGIQIMDDWLLSISLLFKACWLPICKIRFCCGCHVSGLMRNISGWHTILCRNRQ